MLLFPMQQNPRKPLRAVFRGLCLPQPPYDREKEGNLFLESQTLSKLSAVLYGRGTLIPAVTPRRILSPDRQ